MATKKASKKKELIEWTHGYGGYFYLTTDAELKGRGITKSGNGEDHKRGKKTYHATAAAWEKLKKLHPIERNTRF